MKPTDPNRLSWQTVTLYSVLAGVAAHALKPSDSHDAVLYPPQEHIEVSSSTVSAGASIMFPAGFGGA